MEHGHVDKDHPMNSKQSTAGEALDLMGRKPQAASLKPLRGFTIVELMVVVVIMTILVGIGISVGPMLVRSAGEVNNTKSILGRMNEIATEYNVTVGRDVPHLDSA